MHARRGIINDVLDILCGAQERAGDQFDIRVEVRPHWSAKVAFFTLVVDGAGGWLGWWADEPGGDKDCGGLLPPTGIGVVVDFPAFSGGGFLDFTGGPNDRYAGVLSLRFGSVKGLSRFTATAFGLHELTGIPTAVDRDRSWVLVVGTSLSVYPAAGLVHAARDDAVKVLNSLEMDSVPRGFDFRPGRATDVVPTLVAEWLW